MRIGEVNRDNYSYYLQLLGVKNTKPLDRLFGKTGSNFGQGETHLDITV
jgi:hypothetical protein